MEELRSCLAAGGRLPPGAIPDPPAPKPAPTKAATRAERCEALSGDEARKCVESAAVAMGTEPAGANQHLACNRYLLADQVLCVHRNRVLTECQQKKKYPDFDTCVRSFMASAPEPRVADCAKQPAAGRAQCEARNRVYGACRSDRMGYFACLEQRLGPDAFAKR